MPNRPIAEVLLRALADHGSGTRCAQAVLQTVQAWLDADTVRIVRPIEGVWETTLRAGRDHLAPVSLLADAADQDTGQQADNWVVLPLRAGGLQGRLLAVHTAKRFDRQQLEQLPPTLGAALRIAEDRDRTLFQIRLRTLARQLPEDPREACREVERSAQHLFDAEAALVVFRNANAELRRPHAEGDETAAFSLPKPLLPRGLTPLFHKEEGLRNQLQAASAQLGVTIHSLLAQQLGPTTEAMLLVINPLSQDEHQLTEQVTQLAETVHIAQDLAAGSERVDHRLLGTSPAMRKLTAQLMRVAATDLVLLVLGENGTGKELVSRKIHELGARRDQPFLAINCAALTESLLESELFGHEKGAFTDAHESKPGKFEQASGGTLFLDEVGELSLAAQTKLLRVLEEQTVVRVGGTQPIRTDARIIAATHRDLAAMVRNGSFREDLFYRLNVVMLQVPPLRDRGEDVLAIAEALLAEFAPKTGRRQPPSLTREAKQALLRWSWPGNVRELRNLIERLAYLSTGDTIDGPLVEAELAAGSTQSPAADNSLTEATRQFQIDHINGMIEAAGGNVTEAAKTLGLHRSNLYRKMRQLGMNDETEAQGN